MRLTWTRAALALTGLLGLGALVVASGIVPVRASSGHWAVTRWFLDLAMARSVSTHSLGIDVPDLDDPALVLHGAAHYELGCTPCHGRPGRGRSEILLEMTPEPPLLVETLHLWDPAELFYIVRHGVKLTAMPAWPTADRDDEVWAMVAFLRLMPDLTEADYLRLALGADRGRPDRWGGTGALPTVEDAPNVGPATRAALLDVCARCHGRDGRGHGLGAFPSLAGQRSDYLVRSLLAFARGERRSGTMHPIASVLTTGMIGALAEHFERSGSGADVLLTTRSDSSGLKERGLERRDLVALRNFPPHGSSGESTSADAVGVVSIERGGRIAGRGLPDLKVPACVACHGPSDHPRNPAYPILAGQYDRYLLQQLRLFRSGARGGTEFVELMHAAVRNMNFAEMADVAVYYASLGDPG